MTTLVWNPKRSGCYLGESAALNIINREIIVLSGSGACDAGTILGEIYTGTPTVTPGTPVSQSGGTVGNGALGTWTAAAAAQDGAWKIVFTNQATNLGNYMVIRPDGTTDGYGIVGTAYNGGIKGTVADGSADWVEDDLIPFTVAYATYARRFVPFDPAGTDGRQTAVGILFHSIDATSADVKTVGTMRGPATINGNMLTFKLTATQLQKDIAYAALRSRSLAVLPQHSN